MLKRLLDRPVMVTMILLVIAVLGAVSIGKLPVSLIPEIDVPILTIKVTAPELPAREMDQAVVKPLRQRLMQVGSLRDITTLSRDGDATIRMTFDPGTRMDYVFIEANEQIDRSMSSIPDIARPRVFKADAGDIPAFFINLTDAESQDFTRLSDYAREIISKRLEQLASVAMVDISGYAEDELVILPDPQRMSLAGITEDKLGDYISSANIRLGSLEIRDGEYRYPVKFKSYVSNASDIANLWFKAGDRTLQVKDVARVETRPAERIGFVHSNGVDAISLAVIKQGDARMATLRKDVGKVLRNIRKENPEIRITLTRDQTELLEYSIDSLVRNILFAILFACLVIFLFMKDFRSPALIALTIPLSLLLSILVFHVIGLSINIISLSGLVLGIGMMVDNTIILTDNITARWKGSGDLRTAVLEGTEEVLGPMLSSTLTTCAVFIPLIFISGIAGTLFYDQAISVTVVLLSAYLLTITVIPIYYYQWNKHRDRFLPSPFLARISSGKGLALYDRIMTFCLRRKVVLWGVLLVSMIAIPLCLKQMPKSKLPQMSYSDAILYIDWNEHITLDQNRYRVQQLEENAARTAIQTTALIGAQQYVLSHSGEPSQNEAPLYVKCEDPKALEQLLASLRSQITASWPAAICREEPSGNIFDQVFSDREPDLVARLRPVGRPDLDVEALGKVVNRLDTDLDSVTPHPLNLKTDLVYVADPERMALYGVTFSELSGILRKTVKGEHLFGISRGEKNLPVILGGGSQNLPDLLPTLYIEHSGARIPVSALLRQTYEQDLKEIISGPEGNYYPYEIDPLSGPSRRTMDTVRKTVNEVGGFDVSFSGSTFETQKMIRELIFVLLIAVALLFLILASQFESLVQPLIILAEIIIDIAVSLGILWLLGIGINLMSLIGLVVITGIVINDSILKIDAINRLRAAGVGLEEAIHEAGHRRLNAIIMTSLTTILSVVPFLRRGSMGDDLQYPMSVVIIAGMLVGTLVSLFLVPALYAAIYRRKG